MSITDIRDIFTILAALLSIGTALYTWLTSRAKANSHDIKRMEEELHQVKGRVSKIEGEMGHLPSKESFHEMALAMAEMQGEIRVLSERLKPVAAISDRLQNFLIEHGGKAA